MKKTGISIPEFKAFHRSDGRTAIEKDHKAAEAKLDVATRLKRRSSKKIRYGKRAASSVNRPV